eukprot:TRINITY_DN30186_c0_g1_i1.p1 TRINITY_DN30186_c0_g1~~TRINITY_DN30186_c0_g1_i1.p1  ORF type:complete len:652 (+),score=171.22 TRINITY_DN30186_c0_g1_i1:93-2048(+)
MAVDDGFSWITVAGLPADATPRELHVLFSACEGYSGVLLKSSVDGCKAGSGQKCAWAKFDTREYALMAVVARLGTTWTSEGEPVDIEASNDCPSESDDEDFPAAEPAVSMPGRGALLSSDCVEEDDDNDGPCTARGEAQRVVPGSDGVESVDVDPWFLQSAAHQAAPVTHEERLAHAWNASPSLLARNQPRSGSATAARARERSVSREITPRRRSEQLGYPLSRGPDEPPRGALLRSVESASRIPLPGALGARTPSTSSSSKPQRPSPADALLSDSVLVDAQSSRIPVPGRLSRRSEGQREDIGARGARDETPSRVPRHSVPATVASMQQHVPAATPPKKEASSTTTPVHVRHQAELMVERAMASRKKPDLEEALEMGLKAGLPEAVLKGPRDALERCERRVVARGSTMARDRQQVAQNKLAEAVAQCQAEVPVQQKIKSLKTSLHGAKASGIELQLVDEAKRLLHLEEARLSAQEELEQMVGAATSAAQLREALKKAKEAGVDKEVLQKVGHRMLVVEKRERAERSLQAAVAEQQSAMETGKVERGANVLHSAVVEAREAGVEEDAIEQAFRRIAAFERDLAIDRLERAVRSKDIGLLQAAIREAERSEVPEAVLQEAERILMQEDQRQARRGRSTVQRVSAPTGKTLVI